MRSNAKIQTLHRNISLNPSSTSQNFIYSNNVSVILRVLLLNKAYYLQIKLGLILELIKFLGFHVSAAIFRPRGERFQIGNLRISVGNRKVARCKSTNSEHWIPVAILEPRPLSGAPEPGVVAPVAQMARGQHRGKRLPFLVTSALESTHVFAMNLHGAIKDCVSKQFSSNFDQL